MPLARSLGSARSSKEDSELDAVYRVREECDEGGGNSQPDPGPAGGQEVRHEQGVSQSENAFACEARLR